MPPPIALRSTSANGDVLGSQTIAKPAGTVAGDCVVLAIVFPTAVATTITAPSGFTLAVQHIMTSTGPTVAVFTKTAGGSEPSSYTVGFSPAAETAMIAASYTGVDATRVDATSSGDVFVFDTSLPATAPSVTATRDDRVLAIVGYYASDVPPSETSVPAGTTLQRSYNAFGGGSNAPQVFLADKSVAAGSTGDLSTFPWTADAFGSQAVIVQVALLPANRAPNAPVPNAPAASAVIDESVTTTFGWTPSDPDTWDSESAFDLRYRTGAGAWTTVSGTTADPFVDIAGSTFTSAVWEWQVRTYDSLSVVGPWSASSFFTAAPPTTPPVVTVPTSGATIASARSAVTWTVTTQDGYQVRRVADVGGSPDVTRVYWDSEAVGVSATRSITVPFETNSRSEHVQVRVLVGFLWSSWVDVPVSVMWTPPPQPVLTLTVVQSPPKILVQLATPAATGGQPSAVYVDLYRTCDGVEENGATTIRCAAMLDPNGTWTFARPASGVDYEFQAIAYAANGTSAVSPWTSDAAYLPGDALVPYLPGGPA